MNRRIFIPIWIVIAVMTLTAAKCTPAEKSARDAIAGAQGIIVAAQAKYGLSCKANPTQTVCVDINKAISLQNGAITAVQAYCGWSAASPPVGSAKCVPVQSTEAALTTTILNLNQFVTQLKGGL